MARKAGDCTCHPLTRYERAQINLRAFEILEGWGTTQGNGNFKKWDYDQRQREAKKLADWAASP